MNSLHATECLDGCGRAREHKATSSVQENNGTGERMKVVLDLFNPQRR
jgi:hypothetical protein